MTQEGYDKMVAQLKHMEEIERPAASAAIAEARDKGDLSENSEYDSESRRLGALHRCASIYQHFGYGGSYHHPPAAPSGSCAGLCADWRRTENKA